MILFVLSAIIATTVVAHIETVSISLSETTNNQAFFIWLSVFCVYYFFMWLVGKVVWLTFGRK